MQTPPRNLRMLAATFILRAARVEYLAADLFSVLPHLQFVLAPAKMNAHNRNPECILHFGIDFDKVRRTRQGRSLNPQIHRSRILPFDLAFELGAESLDAAQLRKFTAASVRIHRIPANEGFFVRTV